MVNSTLMTTVNAPYYTRWHSQACFAMRAMISTINEQTQTTSRNRYTVQSYSFESTLSQRAYLRDPKYRRMLHVVGRSAADPHANRMSVNATPFRSSLRMKSQRQNILNVLGRLEIISPQTTAHRCLLLLVVGYICDKFA